MNNVVWILECRERMESSQRGKLVKKLSLGMRMERLLKISNEFNKSEHSPRRSRLWSLGTIQRMLKNKTYTGLHEVYFKKIEKTFSYKVPKIITASVQEFRKFSIKITRMKTTIKTFY